MFIVEENGRTLLIQLNFVNADDDVDEEVVVVNWVVVGGGVEWPNGG